MNKNDHQLGNGHGLRGIVVWDGENIHHPNGPWIMNIVNNFGTISELLICTNGEVYPNYHWDQMIEDHDAEIIDVIVKEFQTDTVDVACAAELAERLPDDSIDFVVIVTTDASSIYTSSRAIDYGKIVIVIGKSDIDDDFLKNADVFYPTDRSGRIIKFKKHKNIISTCIDIRAIRKAMLNAHDRKGTWVCVESLEEQLKTMGFDWQAGQNHKQICTWLKSLGGFECHKFDGRLMVRSEAVRPERYNRINRPHRAPKGNRPRPKKRCLCQKNM